ncbi:helix-turn-helix domain-containing protein [Streptomyces scopuliridis]|uniref:helix-turn-helix domain-containing protein n=1 Tax=Streptomyces scopuliridis TaxID=452529 RepID=UPI0036C70E9A
MRSQEPDGGGKRQVSERDSLNDRIQLTKAAIARRLRYVRQHHPEGPFTLAGLAERAGVAKRTLSQAESAEGSNLTIETLVKVAHSLGISRDGYFLDDQVFEEVNIQLATLVEMRDRGVDRVALRTSAPATSGDLPTGSLQALVQLLDGVAKSVTEVQGTLSELSQSAEPPSSSGEIVP